MCLYIRDKEPRIAKRNIVVLKYLKRENERFSSPCQGTPVELGKEMEAYPSSPQISSAGYIDHKNREISELNGGAIHAKLFEDGGYGNYCAKAIIPKGTKYWVDPFGTEIAAEKMLITEEAGSNDVIDDSFAKEILASAPEVNGVRIGDYQMIDDSFVHPKKSIAKTKVRGIVCGFYEDGSPIICALEMFREVWDREYNSKIGECTDSNTAKSLFNGREVTRNYIKKDYKDKTRFGAFERCIHYREDKEEEWFFGALGETMTMLDNAIYLNAAHKITGLCFIIDTNYWYWSCSEGYSGRSWFCRLFSYRVRCSWGGKYYASRVVPFYASKKRVENKKKKNSLLRRLGRLWK